MRQDDSYLIDGVAINGVSGGPVFVSQKGLPELIGSVSAYILNRQQGDTLPGLLRAQDVSPFYQTINTFRSFDEAQEKQEEEQRVASAREAAAQIEEAPAETPIIPAVEVVAAGDLEVPAPVVRVTSGKAEVSADEVQSSSSKQSGEVGKEE